jgi:hypothetical protein
MIIIWEQNDAEKITPGVVLGFVETDEEFKIAALELMSQGKKILAGDVTPITIKYVPADVTLDRLITKV